MSWRANRVIRPLQAVWLTTVLVLSGETRREDLAGSPFQPDFVFENLGALGSALQGNLQQDIG